VRTQKQIEAARRNGAKSRGPVTTEGKARSSQNAIKHSLTAAKVRVAAEDEAAFNDFRQNCLDFWKPSDLYEAELVDDMITCRWRLQRVVGYETELLDREAGNLIESGRKARHGCSVEATALSSMVEGTFTIAIR
jgi:hypothetical protein